MTMLFRLDADAAAIADAFDARIGGPAGDDPWAGGYVAPGSFAPVITGAREFIAGPRRADAPLTPRITPRLWGVPPPPSAHDQSQAVLTVRNPDSPFWIGNLRNCEFRCIVPATAFMEWSPLKSAGGTDNQGQRIQHWFAASDQPIMGFAGVWKDSEVPSFALLTCRANALLRQTGAERMPVIIPRGQEAQQMWLHGDWRQAQKLLEPYATSMMRMRENPNSRP